MYRFHITSDIHLEFLKPNNIVKLVELYKKKIINPTNNYLICAGDIGCVKSPNTRFYFDLVSPLFERIFYVPGNHEYYETSISEGNKLLFELTSKYNNVHLLNKSYYDLDDSTRIIGCTLWSDLEYNDEYKDKNLMRLLKAKNHLNDFVKIDKFSPFDYQDLHNDHSEYLRSQIQDSNDKKVIVVSHHLPSYYLIDEKFKHLNYNNCFASNMDDLMFYPVKYWIYGHTHKQRIDNLGTVKTICNPIGHVGENPNFQVLYEVKV